ncbi:MAG: competence/damage-inducible protein A [Lachnospiraceae bacterium]|nr:competence/damage-inducible protein A [Lachnospiraceae bacterium]
MKAEIIAVGTEILLGDIVNTNAQFLAKELANVGIEVFKQTVIGDNSERLSQAFEEALASCDMVITTGGLGPTEDDLTKETACQVLGMSSVLHKPSLIALEAFFKKVGKEIPESNYKQVYFPKEATVLSNPNGTAPGAILQQGKKTIIVLPGPPKEMMPMFRNLVKPYLMKMSNGVIVSEMVRVLGVGEGYAAEKLKDLIENGQNPTVAPYAKEEDVVFRITAKAKSFEDALKMIYPLKMEVKNRMGIDAYAEGDDITIQAVVADLLKRKNLTIAVAESCTGGQIASRLAEQSGISKNFLEGIVAYTDDSKIKRLGVKRESLEKYTAVSENVAEEMAKGVVEMVGADIGISTTGYAEKGDGVSDEMSGIVFIGIIYNGKTHVQKHSFTGNRNTVRRKASIAALDFVRRCILNE